MRIKHSGSCCLAREIHAALYTQRAPITSAHASTAGVILRTTPPPQPMVLTRKHRRIP